MNKKWLLSAILTTIFILTIIPINSLNANRDNLVTNGDFSAGFSGYNSHALDVSIINEEFNLNFIV